ncbi:hypothetical protein EHS39_32505 [Ensifer sp. MPMI2T]|nr:hypothetical protein EHS39_32505 [Ensifer sp. MPMI2T]
MKKVQTTSGVTVRDPKTGNYVTVRGLRALKDSNFVVEKNIDLTKSIAQQVLKGWPRASKLTGKG